MQNRREWILAELRREGEAMFRADDARQLTVGMELEFFALNRDGKPATHESTQALFAALATGFSWSPSDTEHTIVGAMVPSVTRGEAAGTTCLKYDHHPHLLEITVGPASALHGLEAPLRAAWDAIQAAAKSVGVAPSLTPILTGDLPDSPLPLFRALRWTRSRCRALAGLPPDRRTENYAAGIAANQLHVGGLFWPNYPSRVELLYTWEPLILAHAIKGLDGGETDRTRLLSRRWNGYKGAFPGSALVGFPSMHRWTLEAWSAALEQTSIYADDQDGRAGQPIAHWPSLGWEEFRYRARDLQIIRPRSFGTLEFRADPVQNTIEGNLAIAALRLGLSAALFSGLKPAMDFSDAGRLWWSIVHGEQAPIESNADLLAWARAGLQERNYGEETYLEPLCPS